MCEIIICLIHRCYVCSLDVDESIVMVGSTMFSKI